MSKTTISDYVISFLDLMEAEGRTLREVVVHMGWGFGFIALAVLAVATASGLMLWALYLYLAVPLGAPGAALVVGLLALVLAAIFGLLARWKTR